ncbi:MAG: TerD family protein [Oscillospiraceae bacterium]|nr:TerD family protein [Oscillospiraceae bacterium]
MINIRNNEIKAIRLSDVSASQRREIRPLTLSELSTEKLTPVKGINPVTSGNAHSGSSVQHHAGNVQPVQQTAQLASPVSQTRTAPLRDKLPPAEKLLKKGEKYSITKNHPSAVSLRAGIGWDFSGTQVYDIDIEAFMLDETEKVPDDSWIVFYGQLRSPDGSVIHRGDSSEGKNFGADCEQIDIKLDSVSRHISKIALVMTINEAKQHGYNFSGMKDAYIRFTDMSSGKEIFRYELTDYYREVVSMVVGELYFRNGEWRFNPVGMGTGDDLEGLCNRYGIEVK